jgi:hypothetical protein
VEIDRSNFSKQEYMQDQQQSIKWITTKPLPYLFASFERSVNAFADYEKIAVARELSYG